MEDNKTTVYFIKKKNNPKVYMEKEVEKKSEIMGKENKLDLNINIQNSSISGKFSQKWKC